MNLETLWDNHHVHVRNFVRHKIGNRTDAEDIVQNVFIKAGEGLASLKDESKARSWLLRIAHNCIVDHYRKLRKTEELAEDQTAAEEPVSDFNAEPSQGCSAAGKCSSP
jgi:RNA polymerase sigma factor, sigma-70 family